MNPGGARRFTLALAAAALLVVALGLLWGWLRTGDPPRARGTSEAEASGNVASRDTALALRTLDANGHWGRYTPPAEGVAKEAPKPRAVNADAIAQAYRLVGIQRREGEPVALLLPAGAAQNSADLIRLHRGETLSEGISVSAIERDSVRFSTASGSSTLHLYGTTP